MKSGKHNLTVNGSGSYGGGIYGKVRINGEATISGDLQCDFYKINGKITVNGQTKADDVSIYGESTFNGNTEIEKIKLYGTCHIDGDVLIHENKLRGSLHTTGRYRGYLADIKGEIQVDGDMDVEKFASNGCFHIKGLLNADEIEISPRFSKSYAKEIGGENIVIRQKKELGNLFSRRGSVEAEIIEGDHIYLEYTKAKLVRGTNIEIGPGCTIEVVECSGTYKQSKDTVVNEKRG